MNVEMSAGEKVCYSRDYCKGKANVTVTDKRVISTFAVKKRVDKIEADVKSVKAVKLKYRPVSKAAFVAGFFVEVIAAIFYILPELINKPEHEVLPVEFQTIFAPIYLALGILSFIVGFCMLRSGFYINLVVEPVDSVNVIGMSAVKGKPVQIKLKPRKEESLDLFDTLSAAIIGVNQPQ